MRILFTKNYHVQTGERSRLMYKRGREYDLPDDIANAALEAKCAKAVTEFGTGSKDQKSKISSTSEPHGLAG